MVKIQYRTHAVRCIVRGPSECGKSVFLTNLILNPLNKFKKVYNYSPSLHQDLYQKLKKSFSKHIPVHITPDILNGKDIDIVNEEKVDDKSFEKSDCEKETYESFEELKFPQEYDGGIIKLDGLNEREMNDPSVQAMFKR